MRVQLLIISLVGSLVSSMLVEGELLSTITFSDSFSEPQPSDLRKRSIFGNFIDRILGRKVPPQPPLIPQIPTTGPLTNEQLTALLNRRFQGETTSGMESVKSWQFAVKSNGDYIKIFIEELKKNGRITEDQFDWVMNEFSYALNEVWDMPDLPVLRVPTIKSEDAPKELPEIE